MPPTKKTEKATAKKAAPKKPPAKPASKRDRSKPPDELINRIMSGEVEWVSLAKLRTFPGNPRKGDVDGIAESLIENGQFRPLIVQRSTGFVLGGNHTFMAARKANMRTVAIVYVDCDEVGAKKIVLADNHLADKAGYDRDALAAMVASLPDVRGTGYSQEEARALVSIAQSALEDVAAISTPNLDGLMSFGDATAPAAEDAFGMSMGEEPSMEDWVPSSDDQQVDDGTGDGAFEKAEEEMSGVMTLKDDYTFPGTTFMEIPVLRPDMMVEKLPEPLLTWAGMPTRDWPDPDVWWWFNFGSERTFGMNDVSKMVLAFYSHDQYFDNWWHYPARYVAKALHSGVKYAVTPNFSCEGVPRALSLFALFKSRWIGRYLQEVGIRIIPDIEWRVSDHEYLTNFVLAGIPHGLPYISIQAQNLTVKRGEDDRADFRASWIEDVHTIVDTLEPQTLIIYSNADDFDWVKSQGLGCELHWQETRLSVWSRMAPKKEKRKTL